MNRKQVKYNTYEEFLQGNPNYPIPSKIECLDLVIKKKWAEEIVKGERKYDLRSFSFLLYDRICNQDTKKYREEHKNDEEIYRWCNPIRPVQRIHYHDYANTWSLDVSCIQNGYAASSIIGQSKPRLDVTCLHKKNENSFDRYVEQLQRIGILHDLDTIWAELNFENEKLKPAYFYFIIGEVIAKDNL
ncbi:MAG: hypothetical protein IKS33_04460 [Bacteroidales bacterium]|nr:hypothetical protein [Bacteroidales bacterium]